MKAIHILFAFLLTILSGTSCIAAAEMPIIAYWGVPDYRITDADFRTFRECGFTVSLFPYTSLDVLVTACRVAHRNGVQILGQCPEMFNSPVQTAKKLSGESGFYGYFLQDEPNAHDMRQQHSLIERLQSADANHRFYINLLPCYDPIQSASMTKTTSYDEYLRVASALPCQQLSFDFYPVRKDGLRSTWYHNLEMVRQESIASGKPFWGFVLSCPHADYPQPTMATLRLQVYANLAYGAQAIQYFTYWTPAPNKTYDFHNAPISQKGKKTKTYALVQQMNRELRAVAPLFFGAKTTSVSHLGKVAAGTSRLVTPPVNISKLNIQSREGAIVSELEKDSHRYLVIVNKDYRHSMKVLVTPKTSLPRHITKELKEQPVAESYTVGAGDMLLFKLQ